MNHAPIRVGRRSGPVFLFLAALTLAGHHGMGGAAVKDADQLGWSVRELPDSKPTVASYFRVYEVRAADLRFVLEYYSSDGGMKIRETPSSFRALGRQDLARLLETAAIQDTGVARAMAGVVAECVLPHIGTTDATLLYLHWSRRFGSSKVVWLTWPPPVPTDATNPPAWVEHLADPPIADTLRAWAAAVRCGEPDLQQLYVLCLLGARESASAVPLLRGIFDDHPECRARLMDWIVHGGLPIRDETWDLIMEMLPSLNRRPAIAHDFHGVNGLWYDIARRRRWPTHSDRPSRLERLGAQFVHNVLNDPRSDFLLCSAGGKAGISPLGAMDCYAGDGLGPFLHVCRVFGRAEDARTLERLLGRFEVLLRDASLVRQWDPMRAQWGESREEVIESFLTDRDSTITAVKARR